MKVVITDYPDRELIDMIKRNVKENLSEDKTKDVVSIQVSSFPFQYFFFF